MPDFDTLAIILLAGAVILLAITVLRQTAAISHLHSRVIRLEHPTLFKTGGEDPR